ncbi:MAG: hypothetical protein HFE45_01575 [Oscillospiraceae bacterium]|nr:hypothetical protein [Oscillospiraceae bacterium]
MAARFLDSNSSCDETKRLNDHKFDNP